MNPGHNGEARMFEGINKIITWENTQIGRVRENAQIGQVRENTQIGRVSNIVAYGPVVNFSRMQVDQNVRRY